MKIYFVRHGETQWNTMGRFQGRKNSPLTELGRKQVKQIAENLKEIPFTALYSSSLGRARKTVEAIAEGRGLKNEIMDEFIEISLGDLEGKTRDDFEKEYPKEFLNYRKACLDYNPHPYSGETFQEIEARLERGLKILVEKHQEDENILVVSHGMTLKILFSKLCYGDISHIEKIQLPGNTEIRVVEYKNGTFQMLSNEECR